MKYTDSQIEEAVNSKLTCAPSPPPICSIVNSTEVCLAPPIRCVETCSGGVCTVTCCAAFAPAPVPANSPVMLLLMATVIVIAAYRRIAHEDSSAAA